MKTLILLVVLALPSAAFAQTQVSAKPLTDSDIQLLREDIQRVKNDIITHTMEFTTTENAAFWPVYREFAAAQDAIRAKRLQLITDYAVNFNSMDDAKARSMTERLLAIEQEFLRLRSDYFGRFERAIGAKRAAKFYQVDNRLTLIGNLQITSEIPLIP